MSTKAAVGLTPEAWWDAASHERLMLLRCPACGASWLPWMPYCPDCGPGPDPEAIDAAGDGTIYSWVVIHYSVSASEETPFTVLAVELDEGAMIYGRLIPNGGGPGASAGAPVRAVFTPREGRTVVEFQLANT